jgi:hypothetical protein
MREPPQQPRRGEREDGDPDPLVPREEAQLPRGQRKVDRVEPEREVADDEGGEQPVEDDRAAGIARGGAHAADRGNTTTTP